MDLAVLHRNAKQRFQQFGIDPELKEILALGLAQCDEIWSFCTPKRLVSIMRRPRRMAPATLDLDRI
jgi:hypothetical protein